MYNNIGGKMKILAKVIFFAMAAIMVIAGIVLMARSKYMIGTGLILMIVGPLSAWISSWVLYGFGELIEKTSAIEQNTRGGISRSQMQQQVQPQIQPQFQPQVQQQVQPQVQQQAQPRELSKENSERILKIKKLRDQGLITEEEYQRAISKML